MATRTGQSGPPGRGKADGKTEAQIGKPRISGRTHAAGLAATVHDTVQGSTCTNASPQPREPREDRDPASIPKGGREGPGGGIQAPPPSRKMGGSSGALAGPLLRPEAPTGQEAQAGRPSRPRTSAQARGRARTASAPEPTSRPRRGPARTGSAGVLAFGLRGALSGRLLAPRRLPSPWFSGPGRRQGPFSQK
ncbi:collagen alpha-2(IX) chain-like [Balaenoptera ricei]|uniref:collagen alpha-2(IX) chain-like n=1 Tax=Balaenoptera ricei TaxID=2746895 RepID=UPI0028BE3223|nr:collagen alpha-2(IX) chain-like [Balaenoptera ricei]